MKQVVRPIRWWVRLYTSGLPPMTRDGRRAELESDVWEQSRFAHAQGLGHLAFTLSIWSRLLRGIPDDLMWRAEQRAILRQRARDPTGRSLARPDASRRRLLVLGAGMTIALALITVVAVVNTIEYNEGTQPRGELAALLFALAGAIAVVGYITAARGFRIMRDRPGEGAILVVGGSFVAGLAWYWLLVPVGVAILISVFGVTRAMRLTDAGTP